MFEEQPTETRFWENVIEGFDPSFNEELGLTFAAVRLLTVFEFPPATCAVNVNVISDWEKLSKVD